MISQEENDELTSVGPDTPGGRLLRQYWYPVVTEEQLQSETVLPVRLLGENVVVFRDGGGRLGAVSERCAHRGASLAYGFPEADGLRCPYHGWKFDTEGRCLETPNTSPDSPKFRSDCAIRSYPAQTLGGLVFVYLGPLPAPALPRYDLFTKVEDDLTFRDIGYAVIPCNWLQIMENSCDPIHVEWLHGRYFNYHLERIGEQPTELLGGRHVQIGIDRFEHGLIKRRLREGQSEEHDDWTIGHPVVFPNILKVGGKGMGSFQIRVPIDDHNTLHFWYVIFTVPPSDRGLVEAVRGLPSNYEVKLRDESGRFLVNTIDSQDAMAWVTQGAVADRSNERLCSSDRGVVVFRNMLREQIHASESGRLPINVIAADVPAPEVLPLPLEEKALGIGGGSDNYFAEYLRTQSLYSHRVREAVRLIDESQGRAPRDLIGQSV